MELNKTNIQWINENYPNLNVDSSNFIIEGILDFCPGYNSNLNQFRIIYDSDWKSQGWLVLLGKYYINLSFKNNGLPQLRMKSEEVQITNDRHFNLYDKTACLCGPSEEDNYLKRDITLQLFIEELVLPFLYGQKYYDQFEKWPWHEYSHGILGALESYYFDDDVQSIEFCLEKIKNDTQVWESFLAFLRKKRKKKGHEPCICGSNKDIRNCHSDAWYGLNKLQDDIKKLKINI